MSDDNDDDFLGQINDVVSKAESSPLGTDVINDLDNDFKSEKKEIDSESDAILDLVDTPEEKLARKQAKEDAKKAKDAKPVDQKVKDGEQKTPDQQAQQKTPEQKEQAPTTPFLDRFLKQDDKGNLVLADGTVIATNGKSRAYYEGLKKEARGYREAADKLAISSGQLAQKFTELHDAFTELKSTSGITSIVKETGMTQSEVNEGLRLMKSYKQNPVEAIKSLLTQARMSGIDLSSIGINGGIDPATIARAIADAKDSGQQNQPQLSEAEKSQRQAEKMVDSFFERNPEAIAFAEEIAGAAEKFPNVPLDEIWYRYKIWQRDQLAKRSEQEFEPKQEPQRQQQQQPQRQQITRLVNQPQRNYGAMSIEDIAASVKKDFING